MKKNNISFILLLLLGVVFFVSCEDPEGALYAGEDNKVSFFASSLSLDMTDGTLKIPLGRTSSNGDLTVPVTLTADGAGYTEVFTIENPVMFKSGQAKTYVNVAYSDFSMIDPSTLSISPNGLDVNVGLAFPFSLKIDNSFLSPSNDSIIDVLASNALVFEELGTATLDSRLGWWGGETEDDFLTPKILKAVGANVYKLVSPFEYNSIAFMIMSDGETVVCPNQIIYDHSEYGAVTMGNVKGVYNAEQKSVTLTVGAYTVSAGGFGGGTEIIYLP